MKKKKVTKKKAVKAVKLTKTQVKFAREIVASDNSALGKLLWLVKPVVYGDYKAVDLIAALAKKEIFIDKSAVSKAVTVADKRTKSEDWEDFVVRMTDTYKSVYTAYTDGREVVEREPVKGARLPANAPKTVRTKKAISAFRQARGNEKKFIALLLG
jgi:hypothetical protein